MNNILIFKRQVLKKRYLMTNCILHFKLWKLIINEFMREIDYVYHYFITNTTNVTTLTYISQAKVERQ